MSDAPARVHQRATASTVVIAANPASGRGEGAALADQAALDLLRAGHRIHRLNTQRSDASQWLDGPLRMAAALLVVGGDGTVRACAPRAAAMGVPIRQLPAGTENLFARQFRQSGGIGEVISALAHPRLQRCDLWQANGEPFLLMCSAGFDAEVVASVAQSRGRSISRLTYLAPILQAGRKWRAPDWTVEPDGHPAVELGRGTLVCANCPVYACGLDPIPAAQPDDSLLDMALLPCTTGIGAMGWMLRLGCSRPRLTVGRSSRLLVQSRQPFRVQIDGDPLSGEPLERLEINRIMPPLMVLAG